MAVSIDKIPVSRNMHLPTHFCLPLFLGFQIFNLLVTSAVLVYLIGGTFRSAFLSTVKAHKIGLGLEMMIAFSYGLWIAKML